MNANFYSVLDFFSNNFVTEMDCHLFESQSCKIFE